MLYVNSNQGLPHPQFFFCGQGRYRHRGRVYEPLGCDDDQIGRGSHRYHKSRFGQGLGLLPEIVKSVVALKLLQLAPLCLGRWRAFYRDRVHLGRDRGRSVKKLHWPNRFRVWLHELNREGGSRYRYDFGPVYLNEGLMKPRRGFTLAAGGEKLGVGKYPGVPDLLQTVVLLARNKFPPNLPKVRVRSNRMNVPSWV